MLPARQRKVVLACCCQLLREPFPKKVAECRSSQTDLNKMSRNLIGVQNWNHSYTLLTMSRTVLVDADAKFQDQRLIHLEDIRDVKMKYQSKSYTKTSATEVISLDYCTLQYILPLIVAVIIKSLVDCKVPGYFKMSHVSPLLRKPKPENGVLKNYRSVHKLPFLSKTLELMCPKHLVIIFRYWQFISQSLGPDNNFNGLWQYSYWWFLLKSNSLKRQYWTACTSFQSQQEILVLAYNALNGTALTWRN